MERRRTTVTVGGKGSILSPESIFAVANSVSSLVVDPSLAQKPLNPKTSSSPVPKAFPLNLTVEESRAALLVLVNKLLLAGASSKSRPLAAISLADKLNTDGELAGSFCTILEECGVSAEEFEGAEGGSACTIGIAALIENSAASLCPVVDAVAALSCEASGVDGRVFDLPAPSEGLGSREVTDVAGDLKRIVSGSKLVGSSKGSGSAFSSIPYVHARLRRLVKDVRSWVRVEANSSERKFSGYVFSEEDLASSLLPSVNLLKNLGENSLQRAKACREAIEDDGLRARITNVFSMKCPTLESLKERVKRIQEIVWGEGGNALLLHDVYELLKKTREIVAWEAGVAMLVLQAREKAVQDGANESKEKEKSDKKKKVGSEVVLGKGSAAIRQVINKVLEFRFKVENGSVADDGNDADLLLGQRAIVLCSFFDPKDPDLAQLVDTVKGIVESNEVRRLPKIPKGTRDFGKEQMAIREKAFSIIVGVFKRHGGVSLDTPVFESRETLMGKYGEDSKLIYDLADQGGEICSLRYDLTVPFARYLAMNGINSMRRYQIAKVYRRDNPSKGRYREFYQCDFDIASQYPLMQPDFEVIKILTELLDELNIGDYEIKFNHRKLLDGMLEICGVPSEKFRTVCSSIDKLDKLSFAQVQKELVDDKGLSNETAQLIGTFVKKRGHPKEILADLKKEGSPFLVNCNIVLEELEVLFTALEKSGCINRVVFDLSLARGLDYYTGVIYEAVFKGSTQVGSIAAGGRYDNLVGMFSGKTVPAVGVSLGIERVFTIMEQMEKEQKELRATETQILVVVSGEKLGALDQAAEIVNELWKANLKAEFVLTSDKNIGKQFGLADKAGIPWVLTMGTNELKDSMVKLKDMKASREEDVLRAQMVEVLTSRLRTCACASIECKLFVGSLNKQATEKEIEEIFSPFGRVEDVYIMRDDLKQSRGCGFIKYSYREMAAAAIDALNGKFIMRGCDQPLIVRFADPKRPKAGDSRGGPAFGGPGFGQRSQFPIMNRPMPSAGHSMGLRVPDNSWHPMSPKNLGMQLTQVTSDVGALASGTGLNVPLMQAPLSGQPLSPSQKALPSPQQTPALPLQHITSAYSQSQSSLTSLQFSQVLQTPLLMNQNAFGQRLSSMQQSGLNGHLSSSQTNVPQITSAVSIQPISSSSQVQSGAVSVPHTTRLGLIPTQTPQMQTHQPSPGQQPLALLQHQAQTSHLSFQSPQHAFSHLQQQLHLAQTTSHSQQQQSCQPITQQPSWAGVIPPTIANTTAATTVNVSSTITATPTALMSTKVEAPVTCDWTEHTSPEGYKYYYNSVTRESKAWPFSGRSLKN